MEFHYYIVYQATINVLDDEEDIFIDIVTLCGEVVSPDPIKSIDDINNIKENIINNFNPKEILNYEEEIELLDVVILSWQLLRMEDIIIK